MGILSVVLLVFFIMVAILLTLLVLVQNEDGNSLGGVFAGGSNSAFGSRSGNVLTKATSVLGALFLVICFSLALINRTPGVSGVEAAGAAARQEADINRNWWQESEAPSAPLIESPLLQYQGGSEYGATEYEATQDGGYGGESAE